MKQKFLRIVSKVSMFLTASTLVFSAIAPMAAHAGELESLKDLMSNLTGSETSDHTFSFTLPASGVDFSDNDLITINFADAFTVSSTSSWVAADFTFSSTSNATNYDEQYDTTPTSGKPDCGSESGNDDVWFYFDTSGDILYAKACTAGTFDNIANSENITIFIDGDTSGAGTEIITNPAASNNVVTSIGVDGDNDGTDDHSSSLAISIVDSDSVSVTATVPPTLTFDIDTATTDTNSASAYSVSIGAMDSAQIYGSNSAGTGGTGQYIWLDLTTNADDGASVTVAGDTAGLSSTAVSKTIDITGTEQALTAGTEGFGICVIAITSTAGTGLAKGGQYDGANCDTTPNTTPPTVGSIETTATEIVNSTSDPVNAGRAQIGVFSAVAITTPQADDYDVTLTFIATATF